MKEVLQENKSPLKIDEQGFLKDETPKKPSFDPRKRYKWEPTTKFTLEGRQFGIIYNALQAFLTTPEAQAVFAAEKASNELQLLLAHAVESGDAKEIPPDSNVKKS